MEILSAHSPQWANQDHTEILLVVVFKELGEVPFGANKHDTADYGREIFERAASGEFGAVGEYIPLAISNPVPQVVSRYQGQCALYQAGYLDEINAYMETADPFEKLAWDTISEFRRYSPMLMNLGTLLGLTEAQIDDLFRFASTIVA